MQSFQESQVILRLSFTAVPFVLQNQNFMLNVDQYRYFVILVNDR